MKPGRELDTLVTEKVMGIDIGTRQAFKPIGEDFKYVGEMRMNDIPHYSTDISAAWELMEKFKWAEPEVSYSDEQHCWYAILNKGMNSGIMNTGDSAPHAICLAALKAVGYEGEE
jgi:hypothetical protein